MFRVQVVENRQDIKLFQLVQDVVYKNDPKFIKPLDIDVEDVFNPAKNPAFKDGDAVRFVLMQDQKPVGRAAAFYQTKNGGEKMGAMGFFECIDDQKAANAIFDECKRWLLLQGCNYMDGPVNFGDRDSFWGLLVESHTDVSYRENYQPVYYRGLFENYGFEKIFEQATAELTEKEFNLERFSKLAERVYSNPRYRFEYIDYKQKPRFAADFVEIYNKAWAFHEDFKPLTVDNILKRFNDIKPAMAEGMGVFAYADGKPAGFFINIYEVNQIFRRFNGKMNLWNGVRYLLARKTINKTRGLIFGIIPEFQNLGLETGMIMKFYEFIHSQKILKNVELAWIGDFNPKMMSLLTALGSATTKVHYTYRKNFT